MRARLEAEIVSKIFIIRGEKVMIDSDLAQLYGVETKYLKRQVRRNIDRFPEDFMFLISSEEYQELLRSQNGTLKRGQHSKYPPMVFTEQGVAQISSVVNSERAIKVNILIIRLFTKMRRLLVSHKGLMLKVEKIEQGLKGQGREIQVLFEYIKKLNDV
jgi:ORF6N domain-containing protein